MYMRRTNVVVLVEVAGPFVKQSQSVYNTYSPVGWHSAILSTNFLHLPPISDLDIFKAI